MTPEPASRRWEARPIQARLIRAFVFVLPIVGSVAFVHVASRLIRMPTGSFVLFLSWWALMSAAATGVLIALGRAVRRLLPLVAFFKLSLVFPDEAPSRFRTAMRSNTVGTLEQRVARAKVLNDRSTPVEAAEHLLGLVAELNAHDRLTRGHAERVRAYAQMIGSELHLQPSELDALNWAALLHDVGKLSVPAEILNKVGPPTAAEWALLRRHSEFGEELIGPLREWLGEWSHAVGQHHERWDGGGYPNRLSGDGISLAARIVAVADVFDVITSARSYKPSLASPIAREEIARCAGTSFDPGVVRAFLNISLGRLRLVMGPLSWLAHAPVLGRLPLTPAIGTLTVSLATVAAALTTGVLATSTAPGIASTGQALGSADPIELATREDASVAVDVEQAEGGARVVLLRVSVQPSVGSARVTPDRRLLFTPPPDFNGAVSIGYEACRVGGACRPGRALIRVLPVNDAPTVRSDRATTKIGQPVSIDVLANDSDPEGDPLSILSVSDLGRGRARIVGGRVRWSPAPEQAGTASFRYTAADGYGGRAGALVTIRVTATSAAQPPVASEEVQPSGSAPIPVATPAPALAPAASPTSGSGSAAPPQARVDRFSVPEGGSVLVDVLANDTDPVGEGLSIVSVGTPAHGMTRRVGDRVQFTAPSNFTGEVTFRYSIADARGATDSTKVSATVQLVNDPPSFAGGADQSVSEDAGPQRVGGWAGSIEPGAENEGGQSVSFLVSADNTGLFLVQPRIDADGTLTYRPAPNAFGSAVVTVRARDDGGTGNGGSDTSAPQAFTITVTPVNDPPVANEDLVSLDEDEPGGVTFDVLANDTDADVGDSVVLHSHDGSTVTGGQLTDNGNGRFTYRPAAGFAGSETFAYVARDGAGATASATVKIIVTPVLDAPIAGDDAYATARDTPLAITAPGLLANDGDEDGDALSVLITPIVSPAHGVVALAADGSLTYTPASGYSGPDSFTYRVVDGAGLHADGSVTLTVTAPAAPTSTLYFKPTGLSAEVLGMSEPLAPAAPQLADFDSDGNPGWTIDTSDGTETIADPAKYRIWAYTPSAPLLLDGPVTLSLWSSTSAFDTTKKETLNAYLYDCPSGLSGDPAISSCTRIASTVLGDDPWNSVPSDWSFRLVTIGNVTRTIPAGRELRIKLLVQEEDLWLTMSADYPTALVVTLG